MMIMMKVMVMVIGIGVGIDAFRGTRGKVKIKGRAIMRGAGKEEGRGRVYPAPPFFPGYLWGEEKNNKLVTCNHRCYLIFMSVSMPDEQALWRPHSSLPGFILNLSLGD